MCRLALFALLVLGSGSLAQDAKGPSAKAGKGPKLTLVLDAGGHTDAIGAVAFTPDGRFLVSGSGDHSIRVWDVATGRPRQVIRPPGVGDSGCMALSPDGKSVAVAAMYSDGDKREPVVYLLSLADGKVEKAFRGHTKRVLAVAYSPKGDAVASSSHDGTIRVWNPATGEKTGEYKVSLPDPAPGSAWHGGPGEMAFSPSGNRIAFISEAGDCRFLNLEKAKTGRRLAAPEGGKFVGVAWSPDGKTIATCGQGKTGGCQLWSPDGTAGKLLLENQPVSSVAFNKASDRILVVWNQNTNHHRASLFDVSTGKKVTDFTPTETQPGFGEPLVARCGALSPDGTMAATAGGDGGTNEIYLWKTDPKLAAFPVHQLAAKSWFREGQEVGWTADGKGVAWYSPDSKRGRMFDFADLKLKPVGPKAGIKGPTLKEGPLSLERRPKEHYSELQVVKDGKIAARINVPHSAHKPYAWTFVGPDRVAVSGDWGGFFLYDAATGKQVREFRGSVYVSAAAASPVGPRYPATAGTNQRLRVWHPDRDFPVLNLYVSGQDWIAWAPGGYYAASPGGDRLVGWVVDNGIDKAPTYYPAEQFRARLYRPDVIKRVLEAGSVAEAVRLANDELAKAGASVPRGAATPETLLPPGVTIAVDRSRVPTVKVTVTARAVVAEQKIKSLRLMVDGRRLPDGKGVLEFEPGKEPAAVNGHEWVVDLPPGPHTLSVLARSVDDTPSFSNEAAVLCPPKNKPSLHVLAVGVSQYQTVKPNLNAAHTDAARLKGAFETAVKGGVAYQLGKTAVLQNKEGKRQDILDALDAARKGVKPGDLFVFSFAGHGTRDEGEFFLLAHDTNDTTRDNLNKTAVSGSELRAKLADFPCQVLVILDACHSGEIGGLPPGSDEAARSLAATDVRVAVMCAAEGHQKAKERNGAGVYTAALARALEKGKESGVYYDHDTGELNVYDLQAYVYHEVVRETNREQTPYLKMPLAHPAFTVNQFPK